MVEREGRRIVSYGWLHMVSLEAANSSLRMGLAMRGTDEEDEDDPAVRVDRVELLPW